MIEANRLEFGKGDIGIHMGDTSDVALLVFRNLKNSAPIGRLLNLISLTKNSSVQEAPGNNDHPCQSNESSQAKSACEI